jgi:hypothetical protein
MICNRGEKGALAQRTRDGLNAILRISPPAALTRTGWFHDTLASGKVIQNRLRRSGKRL